MVASIDRKVALERTFAAAFAALDDTKDPHVVSSLYEIIVRHIRSANPMALLGGADVIEPLQQATIPLADGARIELSSADGVRALLAVDGNGNEVAVPIGLEQGEQLVVALRAVQP